MNRRPTHSKLPPPLRGTDADTFVHHTITVRWPRIARRVIDKNEYPAHVNERIQALIDDLPHGSIRPLDDPHAPDEDLWNERIQPYRGQSWLEAPWFFGETYFFRRIIEAVGYFQPNTNWERDPFRGQKEEAYAQSLEGIHTLARSRTAARSEAEHRSELIRLLKTALWGNQADLSMWEVDADRPDHLVTGHAEEHLLADQTRAALDHLEGLDRTPRIDVWADNAGFELVTDLALVDGLLDAGLADPLVVHVKAHPTFVSDATVGDVHATLDRLEAHEDEATQALSGRLRAALRDGRLRLQDAYAWTSPLRAREFPTNVNAELARADLVISKGDANYRRLVGDRHWPYTTPFEDIVSYFPAPLLALRTLKAEVASGLTQVQVDRLNNEDPDWLVSGRWGVIQFADA